MIWLEIVYKKTQFPCMILLEKLFIFLHISILSPAIKS